MSIRPIFLDCLRDGKLIKTYELGEPVGVLPGRQQNDEELRDEARGMLTNDRLAFPPYDGIKVEIRRS